MTTFAKIILVLAILFSSFAAPNRSTVFAVTASDCDFTGPGGTPNGVIDAADTAQIGFHIPLGGETRPGDPLWDPQYDVNGDEIINADDITTCNGFFGPVPPGGALPSGGCPEGQVSTAFGCIGTQPGVLVTQILGLAIGVAGGIAFILMVIGAIRMLVSGGDPEALAAGRDMLTSAIAGLLFIIFSVVILRIIGLDILQIPGFRNP